MRIVFIPQLRHAASLADRDLEKRVKTQGEQVLIDRQPWDACRVPSDEVSAHVHIGYDGMQLLLCFAVSEPEIRAEHIGMQQQVCEDSCVECFIADEQHQRYINFEFNPIGACMAGIGSDRYDRELLPAEVVKQIQIRPFRGEQGVSAQNRWNLLVRLPMDQFGLLKERSTLAGLQLRGNFQKCGDLLRRPHYLTWNHIEAPKPDFHRKACFGTFRFLR